jgi:putative endonuclease
LPISFFTSEFILISDKTLKKSIIGYIFESNLVLFCRKYSEYRENNKMARFSNKNKLGAWGEEQAASYLITQGYQIVILNYRCRYGEIDLIAKDNTVWCFIEVKTRQTANYGDGYQAVTPLKRRHMLKAALFYLSQAGLMEEPARFDIVSIDFYSQTEYRIYLIKNAFGK